MATIRRRGEYQWEAQIRKKGYPPQSRTFDTRKDAEKWARAIERDMDTQRFMPRSAAEGTTFAYLASMYDQDTISEKKSARQIRSDLGILVSAFGKHSLVAITPSLINEFRVKQAKANISGATIRKRISLLGRTLKSAAVDYGIYLPHGNPVDQVRLPKDSKPRDQRLSQREIEAIIAATDSPELPALLRLATETAMRRSEIVGLRWSDIDIQSRVAHIDDAKNGLSRDVPLSSRAVAALQSIPHRLSGQVFSYSSPDSVTRAFTRAIRRARARYEAECRTSGEVTDPLFLLGKRLHDFRHEATSRLFEIGLGVMEVATITGHKDLKMLRRYTHLKAEDLAKKLG